MTTVNINVKVNPYYTGTKVLDGNTYKVTIRWNTTTEKWYVDIEGLTNDVDLKGIALVGGKDLLSPHGYGDILGELWVVDNSGADEDPNYDDMGGRFTVEYTPLED
jgi:hypothetical protein